MKSNILQNGILLFLILASFFACEKKELRTAHAAYFPLNVGNYWIYEVNEEIYNLLDSAQKSTFHVKEIITSSYEENGNLFFRLERYLKKNGARTWEIDQVSTIQQRPDKIIKTDNNSPVIKLVLPISEGLSWNPNLYNTAQANKSTYHDNNEVFNTSKSLFKNTVTVIARNDSSLIALEKHKEVYAPNIGMIYSEDISFQYCQSSPACIGLGIINYGTSKKWTLVESNYFK